MRVKALDLTERRGGGGYTGRGGRAPEQTVRYGEVDFAADEHVREGGGEVGELVEGLCYRAVGGVLDGHDPVRCKPGLHRFEDIW